MKKSIVLLLLVAAVAVAAAPLFAADAASVTGEVIDSACYIKAGAHGEGHKGCAEKCADAGVPLALLEDGTNQVIWLASKSDATSPNKELRPYVAKKVTISGKYAERGGAKVLVIESVKPAA
jgi:hypothetical protein